MIELELQQSFPLVG